MSEQNARRSSDPGDLRARQLSCCPQNSSISCPWGWLGPPTHWAVSLLCSVWVTVLGTPFRTLASAATSSGGLPRLPQAEEALLWALVPGAHLHFSF